MERFCCICGQRKKVNLLILHKMICGDCEWKIVTMRAHQQGYDETVRALNRLELLQKSEYAK